MQFRLAQPEDLPRLKAMYQAIIHHMDAAGIPLWDEYYPCEVFAADIESVRLYVLTEGDAIVSALALCEADLDDSAISWQDKMAKALYIERFGVAVDAARKGVGSAMLRQTLAFAKQQGVAYLRLLVVEHNRPAIAAYLKNGFRSVGEVCDVVVDDDLTLHGIWMERQTADFA